MNINRHPIGIIAQRCARGLRRFGAQVLSIKAGNVRPMIEVDRPIDEISTAAVEMTEQVNGLRRRVYAARHNGCIVIWREDVRAEFEKTAEMSAEEYIAYRDYTLVG